MARSFARNLALWMCAVAAGACAGQERKAGPNSSLARPSAAPSASSAPAAASSADVEALLASAKAKVPASKPVSESEESARPPNVERLYQAHLAEQRDLEFPQLERELSLARQADAPLSFKPTAARYARVALDKLALTPEERAAFERDGVVNVDHRQRYSMAAAYYAIFTRDLPVLVTTDSILHALHRSYDEILKELEITQFTSTLSATLKKSHETLRTPKVTTPKLEASYADVDLYLTVARNLLAAAESHSTLSVPSLFGNDAKVKAILTKVAAFQLGTSELYGGRRSIDYSQFKPRGHYTESPELIRYFQTMIWLGRADTGFVLAPPDKNTGIRADAERELRSASLLALAVEQSGERPSFDVMNQTIDFLVGGSDNLTIAQLLSALRDAGIQDPKALEQTESIVLLQQRVAQGAHQQIRSQVLISPQNAEEAVPPPALFQLFGQRFLFDSYLLSRLVYDSISFKGQKIERMMPRGLDVMAALGNDEATRLLRPELERFHYSSNLLAARRTVEDIRPEQFEQNVASLWLDSLRKLDDVPARGHFPQAMKRTPFRRKQLQTQLASWAELRHDTVLYGKQSYTAGVLCQYPEGYVEPYPEFFARLALLTERAGQRLTALGVPDTGSFLAKFSNTMKYLEILARKELDGQPFTAEESGFLKKTIDQDGDGCGPPTYDGWYTRLIYGGEAQEWKPTVTDVHTDPTSGRVLQEGVGDANFIVVAVDNQQDRAAYVGPVYSYYEFTHSASDRLTDEQWRAAIGRNDLPPRPNWWSSAFPAKPLKRELADAGSHPNETDPRVFAVRRMYEQLHNMPPGAERDRLRRELQLQSEATRTPPLPKVPAKSE
jgi:hypothetical protein